MLYQKVLIYITKLTTFELILLRKRIEDILQKKMEKPNKPIDKMVSETPDELNECYAQFEQDGEHWCPLCSALQRGGDCQ